MRKELTLRARAERSEVQPQRGVLPRLVMNFCNVKKMHKLAARKIIVI
jgi:hypothetical protein